jgi:hypothetical protein
MQPPRDSADQIAVGVECSEHARFVAAECRTHALQCLVGSEETQHCCAVVAPETYCMPCWVIAATRVWKYYGHPVLSFEETMGAEPSKAATSLPLRAEKRLLFQADQHLGARARDRGVRSVGASKGRPAAFFDERGLLV